MSRKRNLLPSYLPHKQSGQARAVWTDQLGIRHQKLLPGAFEGPESRQAFARLQLELEVSAEPTGKPRDGISVAEVLLAYLEFAVGHFVRPDGTTTHEVDEYKLTLRYVREIYSNMPAAEFGPLALKAIRKRFVDAGWCRNLVNQRVNRVRRIFKWAAGEELVGFDVYQRLTTVAGLAKGRCGVRESKPVLPIDDAVVDATLPHLSRYVRGLVEFQRLTGCRPGEACVVRRSDIDTGGDVWLYRPAAHKGQWRGKSRVIALGPKAQELLREYFTPAIGDYLFSPARSTKEFHAARSATRETPRFESHMRRNQSKRVKTPEREPDEKYSVTSYGHAVARACDRAFLPPPPLARHEGETLAEWLARLDSEQRDELSAWRKAHRWHPNQLRHTFATRVRKAHGLEAAQVLLGHSRADVTQVYAERNHELAATIAAQIG